MKYLAIGAHLLRDDIEPDAQAIPVGDLYLSAVEIHDEQFLSDRDLLLRVARVRSTLLTHATFIALRYGFTFSTPEAALEKTRSQLTGWKATLTTHRDHVEMTLKIAASNAQSRPRREDFSSGADYLRALHRSTRAATVDEPFRTAAERALFSSAVAHRWMSRDAKSLELVFLIDREGLEAVRESGEKLRAECPDVPFLLSGPWPLEVFADVDRQ